MSKYEKEPELDPTITFYSEGNIARGTIKMCDSEKHVWRKLSETEVECKACPTVNIVFNVNEYAKE